MILNGVISNIRENLTDQPYTKWIDFELEEIVNSLYQFGVIAAVVICFFFLLVGGIKWITSADDKEALVKAQKTVTAAIVGLVIVFSVWAIVALIKYFFGITDAQPPAYGGPGPAGGNQPGI